MSDQRFSEELGKIFERGFVIDSDHDVIKDFCNTVFVKHFFDYKQHKDDLIQEGFIGIIHLVGCGNYDNTRSVVNFCYTKVRNCMTNYMYSINSKDKAFSTDDISSSIPDESEEYDYYAESVNQILGIVDENIKKWNIPADVAFYIVIYFSDHLQVAVNIPEPAIFTEDFVIQYGFYTSLLEYSLFYKKFKTDVIVNKTRDITYLLEYEGVITDSLVLASKTLDDDFLLKLLYIFSDLNIKFPSLARILRADTHLSIYKAIKFRNFSFEEAAKKFQRSTESVEEVYYRLNQVFSQGVD